MDRNVIFFIPFVVACQLQLLKCSRLFCCPFLTDTKTWPETMDMIERVNEMISCKTKLTVRMSPFSKLKIILYLILNIYCKILCSKSCYYFALGSTNRYATDNKNTRYILCFLISCL